MPYSSYDHDKLEAAETMRIERRIYFEAKDREIAPYASLPIAQLLSMRSESAAAEQAIFDDLKERAAAWEEQAGRTLLLDKTLEYVRTPHVQHTAMPLSLIPSSSASSCRRPVDFSALLFGKKN